jgi:WS/DGAT/MGAT family acyltransferase
MGSYERLQLQDRLFLDVEDPLNNMHIAGCFIFEAGPLMDEDGGVDIDRIAAQIESRLYRVPRYRQRLEFVPIEGAPVWVDDADFNLRYHVRHARLPLPGDERQLKRLCGRIVSQQLDRHKPLWEFWVVEGLEDDRFALITKVHHCLADGISGVDLLQNLLALEPTKEPDPPPRWIPEVPPDRTELLRDAVTRRALAPLRIAGALLEAVRDPRATWEELGERLEGLREVWEIESHPASETPLNRRLGPHRRYDWIAFDLEEVNELRRRLGGTLNDLVVAVVAGAVGRFFERRGITPVEQKEFDFRIACPVSLRSAEQRNRYGNQISMLFVPVPIVEPDPLRRMKAVRSAIQRTKASKQTAAMQTLSEIGEWTLPTLMTAFARHSFQRRTSNLVVTNVPGPRHPLYLLEARLLETYPVVPLMPGQAIAIALFSYCGGLYWGINSDWDLVPDLHDFVEALEESYAELRAAAGDEG